VSAVAIRQADARDVPAMAAIRAEAWESAAYWERRLAKYLAGEIGAREALPEHAMFVAEMEGMTVGLVAGHRTTRHGCHGELEWIHVAWAWRGSGIGGKLLGMMAGWFAERDALRVCVDVEPDNSEARAFYKKYGARDLKPSWMVWEDIRVVIDRKAG